MFCYKRVLHKFLQNSKFICLMDTFLWTYSFVKRTYYLRPNFPCRDITSHMFYFTTLECQWTKIYRAGWQLDVTLNGYRRCRCETDPSIMKKPAICRPSDLSQILVDVCWLLWGTVKSAWWLHGEQPSAIFTQWVEWPITDIHFWKFHTI